MEQSSTPTHIGHYEILSVINRGRLGTVYKAADTRAGRLVALKELTVATDDPALFLLRFYRENKNTPSLQHENIAAVYELGYDKGSPYVVMEYLEGESLQSILASRQDIALSEKLNIIRQVCAALDYAHSHDFLHRDIRPSHIVKVDNSSAKVIGFGLARLRPSASKLREKFANQLQYMSPEQLKGNVELDGRADVYSVGLVLYQLLTGITLTAEMFQQGFPPRLGRFTTGLPEEFDAIMQKALAMDPDHRYSSVADLELELARAQQQCGHPRAGEPPVQSTQLPAGKAFSAPQPKATELPPNIEEDTRPSRKAMGTEYFDRDRGRVAEVRTLQTNAEDAFRRSQLEEALQHTDRALQIDSDNTALLRLQKSILHAQTHEVFISYSSKDKRTADAVCAALESRGIKCWIAPRDVLPGVAYAASLVNALRESRIMALVFSAEANQSQQVLREVERAASRGIPIIPFRIQDITPSDEMEYYIAGRQWLDALTAPLEQHLPRLCETVKLLLYRSATPAPRPISPPGA
jgi:serine/threonine-protein kinase